jgi:hypothetical protein
MSETISRGIVYLAFGERYAAETRRSIASLRLVSDIEVAVVTDVGWSEEPRPDRFVFRDAVRSFRCKPLYTFEASPFGQTLFLDTDTVIARDIAPVFGLLNHYDLGVRFGGAQLNEPGGLEFHTQCNSGVIVFRRNEVVADVFARWLAMYDAAAAKLSADDMRGLNDQRYLAIAIAQSLARPAFLGEYLNFATFENITTASPPVVYHGRQPYLEKLAARTTSEWNPEVDWQTRVWLPNLGGFLPRGARRSDPLLAMALILRRCWNELRLRLFR